MGVHVSACIYIYAYERISAEHKLIDNINLNTTLHYQVEL